MQVERITMDSRTKGRVSIEIDAQHSEKHFSERRRHARQVSVLRVGKIVVNGQEQLCLVRNISPDGLMAQIYAPRKVGDKVAIEFRSGQLANGRVVWMEDGRAGVQFEQPIDVDTFLAVTKNDNEPGWVSRSPRLTIPIAARMTRGASDFCADIFDISQGGAKVAAAERLKPQDQVIINIDGLASVAGTVRWCHGQYAGVAFNEPLPLAKLAQWAVRETKQSEGNPT